MKFTFLLVVLAGISACANTVSDTPINSNSQYPTVVSEEISSPEPKDMKTAYFASGCFWCVEAIYESVKGVSEVINGYSGGHTKNPTYESSNTGQTGHAESVKVVYDSSVVSFATLVDVYFGSQNPTQVNGQGPDNGSQYRSIIFYQTAQEKQIVETKKAALEKKLGEEVAAEIMPFEKFWPAEDYHQDFEKNNPGNPYIQRISIPRLKAFEEKFSDLIKD